jgi:hypothetical protein
MQELRTMARVIAEGTMPIPSNKPEPQPVAQIEPRS